MKSFIKIIVVFCLQFSINPLSAQISVGEIVNGAPTLILNDAQLTDALSYVLNGATLQNTTVEMATDTLGVFYLIKCEGTRNGQANPSQISIILSQSGSSLMFSNDTGCTMECIASLPCDRCDHTIYERCKRQTCTCGSGSGGCNSSITFPPTPKN